MTIERKYRLTRICSGDYIFPSNDGQTLWRANRYTEYGSLERSDGSKVLGTFWRAARFRGSPDQAQRLIDNDPDLFLSWDNWDEWDALLPTRKDAINIAIKASEVAAQRER